MVSEVGLSSQSSGFNSRTADLWGISLMVVITASQAVDARVRFPHALLRCTKTIIMVCIYHDYFFNTNIIAVK